MLAVKGVGVDAVDDFAPVAGPVAVNPLEVHRSGVVKLTLALAVVVERVCVTVAVGKRYAQSVVVEGEYFELAALSAYPCVGTNYVYVYVDGLVVLIDGVGAVLVSDGAVLGYAVYVYLDRKSVV